MVNSRPPSAAAPMPTAFEDILVERTPGIARGRAVHLGPMEELGLGEGKNKNNSKILAGGRGEGGFHTCTQLEDLILALLPPGLDRTPLLGTACLLHAPLFPAGQAASDQRAGPARPDEGSQGKSPGNSCLQEAMPRTPGVPRDTGPWLLAPLCSHQPACRPTAGALVGGLQTNVCAFLPPVSRLPHGPYSALSWSNWSLQWD